MEMKEKQRLRKLQADLIRIDNGERFFFNIASYKSLGLVRGRGVYANDASGTRERIKTEWSLTINGKQIANSVI